MLLWEEVKGELQLEELGLSGESHWRGTKCPVDVDELALLCPEGSLRCLKALILKDASALGDASVEYLASAGCGAQLTSLSLEDVGNVSDAGVESLVRAGCGAQLTSLSFYGNE